MFDWLRRRKARSQEAPTAQAEEQVPPPPSEPRGPLQLWHAGSVVEAEQAVTEALSANPSDREALLVRGLLALQRGLPAEAKRVLEQVLALAPDDVDTHIALGRTYASLKQRSAAIAAFQRARTLGPDRGEPLLQLALLSLASGKQDEAGAHLESAIGVEPGLAEAHFQLGNLARERGRLDVAERHYRDALSKNPEHAEALGNLGGLLSDRGRNDEAAAHLERALKLKPALGPVSFTLAMLRINQQRWADAARLLRTSLAADPKQADANYWLGNAEMGLGDVAEARKAYRESVRLDGNFLQARWGYVMAQIPAVSRTDEEQGAAPQQFALELSKLRTWLRTNRTPAAFRAVGAQQPYYLAYIPDNHRAVLAEYGALSSTLMAAAKPRSATLVQSVGSKCRVGIVSAHVHSHSVWHAIVRGWVEHLDPARFEIHLFHTGSTRDAETEWASRRVARLNHGLGDWTKWAATIADSGLDVLIYPEIGMDSTTVRLASLRLARTQLASWGHPITTGLPTIDAFVSAAAFEPEGASAHYTEKLICLPGVGCCYRPFNTKPIKPDLAAWNISPGDRVLLCPGTPFKYSPRDDALLVEVARRCQPCKLVFFRAEPESLSILLEQRLRQAFQAAGLDFDRLVRFVPWQKQAEFFGWLDRADVYLDNPGFSGFNTTMQAFERGTPVVAWEGKHMRSRFASAILRQAGLDEWVADTAEGFVERIERLCRDASTRDAVRSRIVRSRSMLFDDRATVDVLANELQRLATPT